MKKGASALAKTDPTALLAGLMCQSFSMKLDHVSYAVLNNELGDTVQRIGAELGASFIDGGKHPRFGTRNFILPLSNGSYIEVVAPLDHPAAESVPFGQAVRRRAEAGGGWMSWALQVDDLSPLESRIGREAGEGHRVRPDGVDIRWNQIGVIDLLEDPQLPFFIKWNDQSQHPSKSGTNPISITQIALSGEKSAVTSWLDSSFDVVTKEVNLVWVNEDEDGITSVSFKTPNGEIVID